ATTREPPVWAARVVFRNAAADAWWSGCHGRLVRPWATNTGGRAARGTPSPQPLRAPPRAAATPRRCSAPAGGRAGALRNTAPAARVARRTHSRPTAGRRPTPPGARGHTGPP